MRGTQSQRRQRRDAEDNRERLLAAAAPVVLRDGGAVPLATIAASAGVGIATLYRNFQDREDLLHALEMRAYGLLIGILDTIDGKSVSGLDAVGQFLMGAHQVADQLVLPLHGAPPLIAPDAAQARRSIDDRLQRYLAHGVADGTIRSTSNATDVIVFCALITQPLPHGPNWPTMASRQVAHFLNGLAASGPRELPGPPISQSDIERAFARSDSARS